MSSSKLQAGAAKVNITPPAGVYLSGYIYRDKCSQGVHDDLYARVLLLKTDEETVGIVTLDLVGISADLVRDIRQAAEKSVGIKGKNLMITASHTHSGPTMGLIKGCGEPDKGWIESLKKKTVEGVQEANQNMVKAKIGLGEGELRDMTYNRQQVLKDGTVAIPLQPAEDVVKQGPVDYKIRVLRVDDMDSLPIAILVNFACHPNILDHGNLLISADFVNYMTATVERLIGSGVAIFANGACGNINAVFFNVTEDVNQQYAYIEKVGQALGEQAAKVAEQIETALTDVRLRAASESFDAPLCPLPEKQEMEEFLEETLEKREKVKRGELEIHPSNLNFTKAGQVKYLTDWVDYAKASIEKLSSPNINQFKTVPVEIQVLGLGDIVFIGIPGEPYVEIALAIQEKALPKHCLVVGYANGCVGYIPNELAYQEGGYCVERAHKFFGQLAALAPEIEGKIIDTALKLIGKVVF